uniref:G-protein coupled receptors family 1 profile domain-containing protein n=1 Tax=Hucho hucho TaxID=62062 RepID=A0A4W5NMC3_9TELE
LETITMDAVHLQNTSSNTEVDHCNMGNQMIYKVFSKVMIVEFTLALPLNLSVLYIFLFLFLFLFKFWKTNSIFLLNIVVADLLLVICSPAKAYYFQHGLSRSENKLVCKAMLFMLILNRRASIAFLTVLSIDRYFNVIDLLIVRIKDQHNAETIAVQIYDGLMVLSYIDCLLDPLVYCFCYSGFTDVYMSNICPFLLSNRRPNSSTSIGGVPVDVFQGLPSNSVPLCLTSW